MFHLLIVIRYVGFHFNAYHSKKGEITQIKCWIELSSLVNRTGVLSFKLIALIVIEKF